MENKVLVFIPCYNCASQVVRVIEQLEKLSPNEISEIIFIDNRSSDETVQTILKNLTNLKVPVKVFINDDNYGLGGSHKVAFQYAQKNNFEYVLILHGDDQGDINDFKSVLETKEYSEYDLFLGARFHRKSQLIGYSKFRTFGNIVFNSFASLLQGKIISDLGGSGLNMFKVSTVWSLNKNILSYSNNLTFHIHLLLNVLNTKSKVIFYPITWREDDQVSNVKLFSQAKEILGLLFRFRFLRSSYQQLDYSNNISDYSSTESCE